MNIEDVLYDWTPASMVEVKLEQPDDFLKIKETLTRIGILHNKSRTLYQSCHILHKQGKYFIVHFKEMYIFDNKETSLTVSDVMRRNAIAGLLQEWGLLKLLNPEVIVNKVPISDLEILSFQDKKNWILKSKYNIGGIKKINKNY